MQVKNYRMFHDDSMRSFFRRLTFTPDGSFLLAPGTHFSSFLDVYTVYACLCNVWESSYYSRLFNIPFKNVIQHIHCFVFFGLVSIYLFISCVVNKE